MTPKYQGYASIFTGTIKILRKKCVKMIVIPETAPKKYSGLLSSMYALSLGFGKLDLLVAKLHSNCKCLSVCLLVWVNCYLRTKDKVYVIKIP